MNRIPNIFIQLVVVLLLLHSCLFSQFGLPVPGHVPSKERGNPAIRAYSQLQGNRVRASIFNYTLTGRENGNFPINVETPYEWPKNTGEVYLALTGVIIGAEVTDNKGILQHIIDVPDFRTSPTGTSWNLEPIPGYSNPSSNPPSLANSLDPTTWPAFWPDKLTDKTDPGWKGEWNGYFGKNIFNADQELYAKASDDRYARYADYYPDTTDLTRKGLGLIISQRSLAWSQILIQDDVFLLYTLTNDGTKDLNRVGVDIWFADFVGGNGDSQSDIADFDVLDRFLWSKEATNTSPSFGADPVGAVALFFLETPGNSVDRISNDGAGGPLARPITEDMLAGEIPGNGIDDNGNGLIDEDESDIAFGTQVGTTYADYMDDTGKGEEGSPVVTQAMIDAAATDANVDTQGNMHHWHRWPPSPETDSIQQGQIWLIGVTQQDLGRKYRDNVDNNNNDSLYSYNNLPRITQGMIDTASHDIWHRYKVPGTHVILYSLDSSYLNKPYLNKDGLRSEGVDEYIDNMIDQSRTDKVDNDYDWNPLTDDVGLDGVPGTHDFGEGDGKPTSGVGTGEPGEPHIDLTDVKETDQIGITTAYRLPAGGLPINSDATMWFDLMIPGQYFNPASVVAGDYDEFATSSLFPMPAGDVQPFSMAIILANGPVNDPGWTIRKSQILQKRGYAQETYQNNYKFAMAPPAPVLTAVPGNNRVTLYWNNAPESFYDAFTANIGGDGHAFEGYRVYRSSDPAFQDALTITNGQGTPLFMSPLVVFDLVDGIKGYDSLGIDGIHYYLGDDSGLQHSYVDTTVTNGFTYYYAVVSYSKGFATGGILPAESPIVVNLAADGSVTLGKNVARVVPEANAAGYVNPSLGAINLLQGATTSTVSYTIVDPTAVLSGHKYYLTFQDTTIVTPGFPDTLTTKNYTLYDSTGNRMLEYQNPYFSSTYEQPVLDGFRLQFNNATTVQLDSTHSRWTDPNVPSFVFQKYTAPGGISGTLRPDDYIISFAYVGVDTSVTFTYSGVTFPPEPVNFKVYNTTTKSYVTFGFLDLNKTTAPGKLSASGGQKDRIIFLEPNSKDSLVTTWWFYLSAGPDTSKHQTIPQPGDTAYIKLDKPFLSDDIFAFMSAAQHIDPNLAKSQLNNIKVVPNPYLAAAQWENKNPYSTGRGPRSLHFNHLPAQCTIKIFTVDGELVKTIVHSNPIDDGTEDWNMLSNDNLSISYGVYIYYVDAPGIGKTMGKFAVVK